MIIRKLFKFEGSHIVRDCSSDRCKFSIHGHSYKVELFLTSEGIDNGQMVIDFGLLKSTVKDFIDSFDHTHVLWVNEKEEDKSYFKNNYKRWIVLPCSPSAEMLSLMFFFVIDKIIKNTKFQNGEKNPSLWAVRVHETETGWAESRRKDLKYWNWGLQDIIISEEIKSEWGSRLLFHKLINGIFYNNPLVERKYGDNIDE